MKSRKNGFTLVEILAVLAILSIVLLMVIPGVIKIIEQSNKSMFVNNARTLLRAGKLYYTEKDMMGETLEAMMFEFPNNIEDLDVDGVLPKDGLMTINEEGEIALAVNNGKYCAKKLYDSKDVKITESPDNCLLPILYHLATTSEEVTTIDECVKKGKVCENGTMFAIKVNKDNVYNFYVIDDTGEEVTMIMDRNLGSKVSWISADDYSKANIDGTSCWFVACNDEGPLTVLKELDSVTSDWINIDKRQYVYSDDSGGNMYNISDPFVMRARMLTYTEAIKLKCTGASQSCPSYLYTNLSSSNTVEQPYGYWISASDSSDITFALHIIYRGTYYDGNPNVNRVTRSDYNGVRPVIILDKI